MASVTQDRLYELFVSISGEPAAGGRDATIDASEQLARSVSETGRVIQNAARTITNAESVVGRSEAVASESAPLTGAVVENRNVALIPAVQTTVSTGSTSSGSTLSSLISTTLGGTPLAAVAQAASEGGGVGGTMESIASSVLKSGFGILPLVGGLLGLFGGSGSEEPAPLMKYSMPASLAFQGATTSAGIGSVDYDQNGNPRSYGSGGGGRTSTPAWGVAAWGTADSSNAGYDRAASGGSASLATPQITVNVQAMDARSFLDRSSDIAAAVREAMLNLNSINDVVNDL